MKQILHGDSLEELKHLAKSSIDLIVTDPPYGYSFMGKDWDKAVPSSELWAECLRVLKPGAFCFVMSAPRSDVQMHMIKNLEEAGFRIDFTPIYWTYASGFPKAGNIGKLVDKRLGAEREVVGSRTIPRAGKNPYQATAESQANGFEISTAVAITEPASPQAKALDGSYAGFQPKPAVEVIIVAMKPLSEKTFVDQALKNGKGITWLDDCRIPTSSDDASKTNRLNHKGNYDWKHEEDTAFKMGQGADISQGRFPANLLVSDDVLNDGSVRTSGGGDKSNKQPTNNTQVAPTIDTATWKPDSGSYSRYFDLDKWASTLPFLIVPKASKGEKNKGLEHWEDREKPYKSHRANHANTKGGDTPYAGAGRTGKNIKNDHPTVKPLKLMSYLITLGSRKGDTVLDPFCGSGTTVLAAEQLDRNGIGIEREAEYVDIAKARLEHEQGQVKQAELL